MRMWLKFLLIVVFLFITVCDGYSCTAVIITGKLTEDGRPLLLKHRDAAGETGRIHYYQGEKYGLMALIVGVDTNRNVLCGANTAELSIINMATYNLGSRKIHGKTPSQVMYSTLSTCSRLEDFEVLLTDMQLVDSIVPANFGLIDAYGGAAFYEVGYKTWVKYDVNDSGLAPDGYMVYTNFSKSGNEDLKRGYVRYLTASNIIGEALITGEKITPRWIIDNISRSLRNDIMGIDLNRDEFMPNGLFPDQDMIPNRYSSSAIVFQGCADGKDERSIMWTVLGYPLIAPIIPVVYGEVIPSILSDLTSSTNILKERAFSQSDSDKYYIRYSFMFDSTNSGFTQRIKNLEEDYFRSIEKVGEMYDVRYGSSEQKDKLINEYLKMVEDQIR